MSTSCNCDNECPLATDCTCIEFILTPTVGHCVCDCQSIVVPLPVIEAPEDVRINLDVKGAELYRVAAFVNKFTDKELLIPASRVRDRMTLSLEDVSFTDITEQLGLVVGGPAQRGPAAEAE